MHTLNDTGHNLGNGNHFFLYSFPSQFYITPKGAMETITKQKSVLKCE